MPSLTELEVLNRLDRLNVALTDLGAAEITVEVLRAALEAGREQARSAHAALTATSAAVELDQRENAAASTIVQTARALFVEDYTWSFNRARDHLLNPSPSERRTLGPDVVASRERVFQELFTVPPSELARMRISDTITRMVSFMARAEQVGPMLPEGILSGLVAPLEALQRAYSEHIKEGLDDAPLNAALEEARAAAIQVERGLRLLLEGALLLSQSPLGLEDFIERRAKRPRPTPAPAPEEPSIPSPPL